MDYEKLRNAYKPDTVKILFVGESRPQQGTFFYLENSNLFSYTKQAFENAKIDFSLSKFKELGCWLYDVCDCPVNGCSETDRNKKIDEGIKDLTNTINQLKPEFIIVVKQGYFGKAVMQKISENGYIKQKNALNLPFPSCGHQHQYRDQLAQKLEQLIEH